MFACYTPSAALDHSHSPRHCGCGGRRPVLVLVFACAHLGPGKAGGLRLWKADESWQTINHRRHTGWGKKCYFEAFNQTSRGLWLNWVTKTDVGLKQTGISPCHFIERGCCFLCFLLGMTSLCFENELVLTDSSSGFWYSLCFKKPECPYHIPSMPSTLTLP